MKCENAYCCSNSNEVIDFDDGGLGGPPDPPGGAGALRFLLDLGGPVNVLMSGDVGLSPGVTHPDSSELMLLSPALYKWIFILVQVCMSGNVLARVQRVHAPADLWDITFCTR